MTIDHYICKILTFYILSLLILPAQADEPPIAQDYLFLGAPYTRANGHAAQASTTFQVLSAGPSETIGRVSHQEYMGSFDLAFSLNCNTYVFKAHADIDNNFIEHKAVSFVAYPEWVEVRFPDGELASIGAEFAAPSAADSASKRFHDYSSAGEPQTPIEVLIDGQTNWIISRHTNRIRYIAEALIARRCLKK